MSRTIGPSGNGGGEGAKEASIQTALECTRAEEEAVESVLEALESFERLVEDIEPHMGKRTGPNQPRVLSDSAHGAGAEAALDAFRESFGCSSESDADDDVCLRRIAAEFSQELAEHLRYAYDQGAFPPAVKKRLLAEIRQTRRRHRSALDTLEAERDSLKDLERELEAIYSRLEEMEPNVGDEIEFSTLVDRYNEIDEHLSRLDDLAEARQSVIHSESGEHGYIIDHRRFTDVIYAELRCTHPALKEIADCAEACKETRRNLLIDLGLAD